MNFREISITDLTVLSDLYIKTFNAPPWNDEWTEKTATTRLAQMINCAGFYGIILMYKLEPCGFVLGNKEEYYNATHFQIKEMCIVPSEQRCGCGTLLMQEMEQRLQLQGVQELYLFTGRINEIVSFYSKNGFEEWTGMVLMGKKTNC